VANVPAQPIWYTDATHSATQPYFVPATPPQSTPEAVQAILETLLTEGLDLKISLDESDGKVTAEVEVSFKGKVIASDSDSIQL
jgi:hypothetical protein